MNRLLIAAGFVIFIVSGATLDLHEADGASTAQPLWHTPDFDKQKSVASLTEQLDAHVYRSDVNSQQIGAAITVGRYGDSDVATQGQIKAQHNGTLRDPYDSQSWPQVELAPQHHGSVRDPYDTDSWATIAKPDPQHNGAYRHPYDTQSWTEIKLAPKHNGNFRDPYDTDSWSLGIQPTQQHNGTPRDPYASLKP